MASATARDAQSDPTLSASADDTVALECSGLDATVEHRGEPSVCAPTWGCVLRYVRAMLRGDAVGEVAWRALVEICRQSWTASWLPWSLLQEHLEFEALIGA